MTRNAAVATALLAGLALASAAHAATLDGDAERGAQAYERLCAECHANVGRLVRRLEGADDAEKARNLEAFLPLHYAEDDQERADVIAYLLAQ
ncbi:c-type cytochrome [Salinarimonas sp.]|uniref:c-type cytochrome n=1 Tax=Salinarimonas sp. TaxID=2766526 RepID=UPI00391DD448